MTAKPTLLIGGVDISAYSIVYGAPSVSRCVGSLTGKTVAEDIGDILLGENTAYDFDRQSAARFAALVHSFCGVELPLVCECEASTEKKVLVGRACGDLELSPTAYVCNHKGNEYRIMGGSFGATWHAMDAIEKYFAESNTETVDLADAGVISGTYPLRRVACLGDSITRGSQALPDGNGFGAPDGRAASYGPLATSHYFEQYLSYPANLARALWKEYLVFNFGQGNATMRYFEDWKQFYYHGTGKFASCLAMSDREDFAFDAVIVMLGTNDSGRAGGAKLWGDTEKSDYTREAEALLQRILAGSPKARFALMNVPHRCNSHKVSESDDIVRAVQKKTVETLADKGYDICLYDMYAYSCDHMGVGHGTTLEEELVAHADYYNIRTDTGKPDTTHPNFRGYYTISRGVRELLAHLLEDAPKPTYLV